MSKEGKKFEKKFRASAIAADLLIERLNDSMTRFRNVKNVCDFIVFRSPFLFFLELKSYSGDRIPTTAVSDFQRNGLLLRKHFKGVFCGVVLQFRNDQDKTAKTYFLEIEKFEEMAKAGSSVHVREVAEQGIELKMKKYKRSILFHVEHLLNEIAGQYGGESRKIADIEKQG